MHIRELQMMLVDRAFNPYIDIGDQRNVLIHFNEECGEVNRAYRKGNLKTLKEEIGDILILISFFASSLGVDLEECLQLKLKKNIDEGKFKPNIDHNPFRGIEKLFGDDEE